MLPADYPQAPPKGALLPPAAAAWAPGSGAPVRLLPSPGPLPIIAHLEAVSTVLTAGYFLTRIFHPNISKAGEICVNTLKKDWQASFGIGHVLQVVRCLLINPFPESALNEEAGKLFMEDYAEYAKKVRRALPLRDSCRRGAITHRGLMDPFC